MSGSNEGDRGAGIDDQAMDILFREARSYNGWLPFTLGEREARTIYDLARFGPTSTNGNPARFVWALSAEAKEKVAACVMEGNKAKVLSSGGVAIIGFDTEFHRHYEKLMPFAPEKYHAHFAANEQDRLDTAFRNSSLQGAYLMMAARALGYDCGPISGFNHDAMNAAFFEGTSVRANFICCIGRGDPASLMPRNPRFDFDEVNSVI
ncbi:malonic semialdehyde reductase [Croceicoccus bisphenolivorans]|uniref:malonic semialdehyde reductase n=1 Tax=Croceicoccus bisphenolivorans TaxID=1783232 RepID=UPI00082EED07|nr:malonic semialdehyde reductase [Croceicoccus bisphenolivorans]